MSYCHMCGTELPEDARFCPACGTEITSGSERAGAPRDNTAAERSPSEPALGPATADYAGLGRRFIAHLVDGFVVAVLFWVIGMTIAGETGGVTNGGFALEGGPALAAMSLTFAGSILYFALMEASARGQTLGKRLVGIRVTRESGERITFSQALIRNIARLVDGLVFYLVGVILVLTSDKNQRLGDRIADTIVVRIGAAAEASTPANRRAIRSSIGRGSDYLDS